MDVDQIFLQDNDSLVVEDSERLSLFLDFIFSERTPWSPPGRNEGRTAAHRERYCFGYFLAQEHKNFSFPIEIRKTERPDFIITDQEGCSIGIEHTDAGPEAYQRWLSQTEGQDATLMAPDREGQNTGGGFCGNQSYKEAAADLCTALYRKTASINKDGYHQADEYVLIIYLLSNAPLIFEGDFDQVIGFLPPLSEAHEEGQAHYNGSRRFKRVLIILENEVRFWPA
ncbi:MAG: hypothetical protein OQK24_13295 [Magnetovibrio sp.]|nr:hypothetical protein [Magnetovibrio sp.]